MTTKTSRIKPEEVEASVEQELISERFGSLAETVGQNLQTFRKNIKLLSKGELIRVLKHIIEHPVEKTVKLITPKEVTLASLGERILQDKIEMTLEFIADVQNKETVTQKEKTNE